MYFFKVILSHFTPVGDIIQSGAPLGRSER